jgi:hypothetical protein
VPENKVGRGFSWLARNINISVTHALLGCNIGVLTLFNLKISSPFAKFLLKVMGAWASMA